MQLDIESLDHLATAFDTDGIPHHSQMGKKTIKMKLLFWVSNSEDINLPVRLISIRVPKSLPVYRVRAFVTAMEQELSAIYGHSKRANLILTCPEDSTTWEATFALPMYDVQYA